MNRKGIILAGGSGTRLQPSPDGLAQAFILGEEFIDGDQGLKVACPMNYLPTDQY